MDTTDFLAEAERVHTEHGFDFPKIFDYYFRNEWVFKGPGYFLMGGSAPGRDDAWFVWWAQASKEIDTRRSLRLFLRLVPYHKPYIGWARRLKGRFEIKYYSTERLLKFTQSK